MRGRCLLPIVIPLVRTRNNIRRQGSAASITRKPGAHPLDLGGVANLADVVRAGRPAGTGELGFKVEHGPLAAPDRVRTHLSLDKDAVPAKNLESVEKSGDLTWQAVASPACSHLSRRSSPGSPVGFAAAWN